ncbi:MAG: NAD(P)H-hydrate dehydratase [Clostridia bacterium]|nr:NAD(P)H-hydrate dehydratase [Clostridia bacterium]
MKVVTPKQMSDIDNAAITKIGIPGVVLMENAALRVVEEILKELVTVKDRKILVFAGKGNNGGDAFAVARHLFNKGALVKVYILAEKESITKDAGINLSIIDKMGVDTAEVTDASDTEDIKTELERADIVIDGIFGTGLKGEVKGTAKKIIELINSSKRTVIAIDTPSGVCGTTGNVLGAGIKADKTVTFALPKLGLIVHPADGHVGELVVADIGMPEKAIADIDIKTHLLDRSFISGLIPKRAVESNKGDYGRVLILSGSTGMTGAGILSAGAALRTGAGLVYLGVPALLASIYDAALIEAVIVPLEDEGKGILSQSSAAHVLGKLQRMSAVAVGPGLSTGEGVHEIVRNVVCHAQVPVILDADALNVLAGDISLLANLRADAVLTPHPGEMSRLTGISIDEIQKDRIGVSREFACKWKVTLVLKGSKTVIAFPDGNIFINTTGNSGMATAGTGDVLTGIIASFVGQGLTAANAAIAGVYLHGLAGDNAARIKGEHGLVAGDLVEELPYAIKQLSEGAGS